MEQIGYLECSLLWGQRTSKSFVGDTWLRRLGLTGGPVATEGEAR